jgi:hypothetical protein
MKRIVGCMIGLVLLAAACENGSGTSSVGTPSPSARPAIDTSSGSTGSIVGVWRQDYSCEQSVRTFHRLTYEHGAAGRARYKRSVREQFAWGHEGATELTPAALCRGARDRYRIMKVADGRLTFFDGPNHAADLQATFELVSDHTFTVSDGNQNLDGTETFTFRIEGERLTVVQIRGEDEWSGTAFEEAPFVRVS